MGSLALLIGLLPGLLESVSADEPTPLPACCDVNTLGFPQCDESFPDPPFSFWPNHSIKHGAPILCSKYDQLGSGNFSIQVDGTLVKPHANRDTCLIRPDVPHDVNGYCLDYDVVKHKIIAYVCVSKADAHLALKICSAVSAVLLAITIAIYSTSKSSLQWSCSTYFVSQSIALEGAFVVHSVRLFTPKPLGCTLCLLSGYFLQYFFLAAFFWMNANCGNIYLITSRLQLQSGTSAHDDMRKKRFLRASVYAWGVPSLICLATFLLQKYDLVSDQSYRPEMSFATCFLYNWKAKLMYFYAPMAVILVGNMALFGLTFTHLAKHKSGSRKVRTTQTKLQRELWYYKQYVKLFIITGLSWAGEVIGYTFNQPGDSNSWKDYLWLGLDIFNCLHGFFVFNIFVCPKKIRGNVEWLPEWLRVWSCQSCYATRKYSFRSNSTHITQDDVGPSKPNGSRRKPVDVKFEKTGDDGKVLIPSQTRGYGYTSVKTDEVPS